MAAPENNKYAEKWTPDEALAFVHNIRQYVEDNKRCVFIGEAVVACGGYRQLWNYLTNKFEDNKEVFDTIRVIESILESRLFTGGLYNSYNARLVEFGLKNNHGWEDKRNHDHTSGGEKIAGSPIVVNNPQGEEPDEA